MCPETYYVVHELRVILPPQPDNQILINLETDLRFTLFFFKQEVVYMYMYTCVCTHAYALSEILARI